ncbi:MAG: hydroxyacylglutathione hydrolase [Burkholderiales bacterium 28-67-8]|nr:MAG: hydroxyacylglutathione hydrolase [Burkholderiales bacterium 28-67-8]
MYLLALPAFNDNYIWMFHDGVEAAVVDPGDCAPVLAALDRLELRLAAILVTHHHQDHVGGLSGLNARFDVPVYAPALESIPGPCIPVAGGDTVLAIGSRFEVIDVPGHTGGHIAYFHRPVAGPEAPLLFCGDTLFSGGCGRLFEGTPQQMHHSLQRLAGLPGNTRVCCAHEYTLSNLKFAHAVEPDSAELNEYTRWCEQQRTAGLSTLPARIDMERAVNPFLRCDVLTVISAARRHGSTSDDPLEVFAALRQWKNEFR